MILTFFIQLGSALPGLIALGVVFWEFESTQSLETSRMVGVAARYRVVIMVETQLTQRCPQTANCTAILNAQSVQHHPQPLSCELFAVMSGDTPLFAFTSDREQEAEPLRSLSSVMRTSCSCRSSHISFNDNAFDSFMWCSAVNHGP